jgi:hypothetical protein
MVKKRLSKFKAVNKSTSREFKEQQVENNVESKSRSHYIAMISIIFLAAVLVYMSFLGVITRTNKIELKNIDNTEQFTSIMMYYYEVRKMDHDANNM